MAERNVRVVLRRVPEGKPQPGDLGLEEGEVPQPGPGQVLVRHRFLSLDPYMGSAIRGRHMSGGVPVGGLMPGETVGEVVASNASHLPEGTMVLCRGGWQSFSVADAAPEGAVPEALSTRAWRLPDFDKVPASYYLGCMGMPGLTAWAGTVTLTGPKPGETFLVSAATGAVGSTAGQIARIMGARVVGIAGSPEKCDFAVRELGYAACVDYKQEGWEERLREACPDGAHCYFDNVGGRTLEVAMQRLARGARIVLVGMMEQYSASGPLPGPNLAPLFVHRAEMRALVVYDHYPELATFRKRLAGWISDGRFTFREERVPGLAAAPEAFSRLMAGQTFGKVVVEVG
ncbi:MAG TPA: NADP-dependent oxidoreductase [Azospirillaceae bacterium]|nr:NADP-dependent oxidoreductase [Azospirillaceae bacterium]